MIKNLFQLLSISCRHKKITKPFAAVTQKASGQGWETVSSNYSHYVVCLDCGQKFSYDWAKMQVIK
ncbi:MAG TPA: hypothetical protein VFZ99_01340 [Terriglobales bacterium]